MIYNFLKHISKNHEVWLLSLCRSIEEDYLKESLLPPVHARHVITINETFYGHIIRRFSTILTRMPSVVRLSRSKEVTWCIQNLIRETDFNIIHIFSTVMGQYIPILRRSRARIILDQAEDYYTSFYRYFINARPSPRKLYLYKDWRNIEHFESQVYPRADLVVSYSKDAEDSLLNRHKTLQTIVIPHGADESYLDLPITQEKRYNILFVGPYFYRPNVEGVLRFYHEVFPLIREKHPQVRLYLVGAQPSTEILELGKDISVEVTGYVTDLKSYLSQADVCIAPIYGGAGYRNKTLLYLSAGKAVVSSREGTENLELRAGYHLLVNDDSKTFAEQVNFFLDNPEERKVFGERGRNLIKEKYVSSKSFEKYNELYQELLQD
jgi:glycosyltransferase involved in cell wall biosynthesis